ncbi:FAD-binding oxidoreductase [uncultured Pelagimonas sp.]|uniref:NAD(P)/FAD-dependent oxidoreductase n=1 Tax=uncultured Pelagimonas sp. TaxID=1618102 RepID=UPI00263484B0|nr:FAD-binding oxidoreductase [uncultured Pelagimonas sp.]
MRQQEIIVVGAGVVGISIALELQTRGATVRILDRKGVAAEASHGNAGAFAFSDIVPLATPGIMRRAPKWLLDPMGPLSIPPAYALKIAPWMLRFWRASWRDRYEASMAAQTRLMELSRAALDRQISAVDGEPMMQRDGQLQLYEGAAEYRASLPNWEMRRRHGIKFSLLENRGEIADIQPGLHPRFTHAAFTPNWVNTADPKAWSEYLALCFCDRGGVIEQANVMSVSQCTRKPSVITSERKIVADQVIIAAGAWSHHLAQMLGDKIPLETERGYNTTLPKGAFDLRTHLTFGGHGFVVSKIAGGVRVGGAVELGGLTLAPNYKRAEILLQKAAKFMPELNTADGEQWMGFRPSMPDSLPVIGRSPRANRVIYAFGHGHLGLTQSAGTAELVAEMVTGATTSIPMESYSPTRF